MNPCPSDMIIFTCTRSESSAATVLWAATGTPVDLYRYEVPRDIGTPNATQTSVPGFTGVIVNETTFTLLVDLAVTSTWNRNLWTNG